MRYEYGINLPVLAISLKIPTGGGKSLLAANAVKGGRYFLSAITGHRLTRNGVWNVIEGYKVGTFGAQACTAPRSRLYRLASYLWPGLPWSRLLSDSTLLRSSRVSRCISPRTPKSTWYFFSIVSTCVSPRFSRSSPVSLRL